MGLRIVATGMAVPDQIQTAEALAPLIDRTPEWIIERAGVTNRRVCGPDDSVSEYAARAALAALSGGPPPDLLINASATPVQIVPDSAPFVLRALGEAFDGIPCFTVNAACLSFLVALNVANGLLATRTHRRILIVSSEFGTRGRNLREAESAALLGDGAAAAVVEWDEGTPGILHGVMGTWPEGAELTQIPGGGMAMLQRNQLAEPDIYKFTMNSTAVHKMARRKALGLLGEFFARCELTPADLDLVIPHQASGVALTALARYGFLEKSIVNIINDYGNCVAASMPMALAVAHAADRLRPGAKVLFFGTGAGLSVAATLLQC